LKDIYANAAGMGKAGKPSVVLLFNLVMDGGTNQKF
jgi:hypothetical protein